MELNITSRVRETLNNRYFWFLLIVTAIAIIIRSIPAWIFTAWGCDIGIYMGITNSVVETKEFFPAYYGWGGSYNEFPILYAVVAIAYWITGIEVEVIMPKLIPFIGALTIPIFYFIVKELTENKKIAILSALMLSVSAFHVYQLSHAAPLVIGHFFMMLSMYFFIKYRQKTTYIIPLIITTILLIMSHHFTTYIYLISLISIIFFENLYSKEWTSTLKKDVIYYLLFSSLSFTYWAFVAKTVFYQFISAGFTIAGVKINPVILIALFYIAFFFSFVIIKYFRKLNIPKESKKPTIKFSLFKFIIAFIILLSVMLFFSLFTIPIIYVKFTALSIFYSIPVLILFSFVVAGFRYTRFIKGGIFLRGWIIGLLLSTVYSIVSGSTAILPERHPEYFSIPAAAISVIGLGVIFSDPEYKILLSKLLDKKTIITKYFSKKVKISHKKRLLATIAIIGLIFTNGTAVYVVFPTFGPDERLTDEDFKTRVWLYENLDVNTTVIASDHRLERLFEGMPYNFTTTGKISDSDKAIDIWSSENVEDYLHELYGIDRNYSKITHVIVDSIMKYSKIHVGRGFPDQFLANETWTGGYDKFNKEPFELIYRNESAARDPVTYEPISWVEVFEVNWTYIEEYHPIDI